MSPSDESKDLTQIIEADGNDFVVLRSPKTAEYQPDYRELGRFASRTEAEAFFATDQV
jgi:hypothetical protein